MQDMDDAGIMQIELKNQTPKDQRVLHQQRAVVMNSEASVEHHKAWKANKAQKQAQRLENVMTKAQKRVEKRRLEDNRDRYEIYFESLSDVGKKIERANWKIAGNKAMRIEAWIAEQNATNQEQV
jgi:hypothetical protein